MPAKSTLAAPAGPHMNSQTGMLGRHGQQQLRKPRGLDYVMLSGAISVAIALAVLLATSHRMVHLGSQDGSRVKVRLKTLDHLDHDLIAAEALASGKPEDIGSYFTVDRKAEGERLMRHAYPQYAARLDNAKEPRTTSQLPQAERAEGGGTQDGTEAQQDGSVTEADQGQGEAQSQREEARGKAQPLEKGDTDAARQDGRAAREGGEQAAADVSSGSKTTEIGERRSGGGANEDRHRTEAAGDGGRRQQDGAAAADKQKVEEGGANGGLGKGIWVIDLTVDDPAALKDGEDTYMVKMWKALEEQRRREELDPAKEAGSVILELAGSDAGVQRLRALGAQVRAKFGQPSASEEAALEGPAEQLKVAGTSAGEDKAADAASLNDDIDTGVGAETPLRLVTLFRDREVYKEPENPKLATWKQDLDRRLLELEEAAAVRRKALEQEQAHLFPHIPLVEGILESALEPGLVVKGLYRPAAVDDLLDGPELEQRLRDEGRLDGILRDPELMPSWDVQLQMQQAGQSIPAE